MYLAPTMSDTQNVALWVVCSFLVVFPLALFGVGVLGLAQRNR